MTYRQTDRQTDVLNIMTSCDQNLIPYLYVQLKSISDFFKDSKHIDYYLFQYQVSEKSINDLTRYCEFLGNITFHNIFVDDVTELNTLAKLGGSWPAEAYFPLVCHHYLPKSVDRILYIDAGDVVFYGTNKTISQYYDCDFNDKLLFVTQGRFKSKEEDFSSNDLLQKDTLKAIGRGLFNSGSYMINVQAFKERNINLPDMIKLSELTNLILFDEKTKYFGDQGFFSIAFVDDIEYFPSGHNLWYMPYNFCIWFFDRGLELFNELWYEPNIIHFAGGEKPWNITSLTSPKLKKGQMIFYKYYKQHERTVNKDLDKLHIKI